MPNYLGGDIEPFIDTLIRNSDSIKILHSSDVQAKFRVFEPAKVLKCAIVVVNNNLSEHGVIGLSVLIIIVRSLDAWALNCYSDSFQQPHSFQCMPTQWRREKKIDLSYGIGPKYVT